MGVEMECLEFGKIHLSNQQITTDFKSESFIHYMLNGMLWLISQMLYFSVHTSGSSLHAHILKQINYTPLQTLQP